MASRCVQRHHRLAQRHGAVRPGVDCLGRGAPAARSQRSGRLTNKLSQYQPGYGGEWRSQLVQAEPGRGPMLFDWLVEIIAGHEQIELRLE